MRASILPFAVAVTLISCTSTSGGRSTPGPDNVDSSVIAPAESKADAAEREARNWLALTDGGRYDESWGRAASMFRAAVKEEQWRSAMDSVRAPLSAVESRTLRSAEYSRELAGAPDGDYMTIRYATVFAQKAEAVETVAMTLEKGKWRVAGYFIR